MRLLLILAVLVLSTPASGEDSKLPAGCGFRVLAADLAHNLKAQHVGNGKWFRDSRLDQPGMTNATDTRILIITFACRGDYIDERQREDDETARGEGKPAFWDDDAMAIVGIQKGAPTPREAAIIRATLAAATGD